MFCTFCGSQIAQEQVVCSNCGRASAGARMASAARNRVGEHAHLLAILWFVVGVFWLIPAVVMACLATFVSVPLMSEEVPRIALLFGPGLFAILCVAFLGSAVCHFAVGFGLLRLRPWGRTFALVMAFIGLLHPPFDTALGIYTLFVLLPDAAGDEYRQMSQQGVARTATGGAAIAG